MGDGRRRDAAEKPWAEISPPSDTRVEVAPGWDEESSSSEQPPSHSALRPAAMRAANAPWSEAALSGARTMVAGGEVVPPPAESQAEQELPWPRLGRLELKRLLGVGGMGRVYEARDASLGRDVAIKVIHQEISSDSSWREQFIAEAKVTAQLEHPNIVPLYDVGTTDDGSVFLVMRKVEGRSLGDVLGALDDGDPATLAEWTRHRLLSTFLKVCHAVAYAHAHGVLHRDLKPPNIMLGAYG
ncbi:MAG: serine/threonine protein kinase, partial [Deltaproteobacteria bacterium]|nr:serine/threonine protein kinase [Deltaproteobacteria bacterium]MBW2536032.1 serine/threonine protein kinase [Deltaproteobacteria bacterium]